MLITISNLFPRPDQPTRGLYNFYLFREVNKQWAPRRQGDAGQAVGSEQYLNICLVPEWRVWRWPAIRRWTVPRELFSCPVDELLSERPAASLSSSATQQPGNLTTEYLPVFYLPLLGRSLNWWFYYRALRHWGVPRELISCPVDKLLSERLAGRQTPFLSSTTQQPNNSPTDNAASGVILTPWLYPDGVAVARAIRGTKTRLWLMALGSDTFHLASCLRRRKILEACTQAEGIVCVAQVLADRLAAAGVPREKLHVVPNGIDASLFRVRSQEELSGKKELLNEIPSESLSSTTQQLSNLTTILYVGNLAPIKGPDILLRAFAALGEMQLSGCQVDKLLSERPAASLLSSSPTHQPTSLTTSPPPRRLILIGDGPERARLEALARDLGIVNQVHFLGRRSREEVALWMNRADVLCLSSRSEGMPNVVLEARASGLPVVTTPAGAIPELPLNQDHFRVVKSCRPEDLAEGLHEMLARGLTTRTPDPAIASWGVMASKMLKLMEKGNE